MDAFGLLSLAGVIGGVLFALIGGILLLMLAARGTAPPRSQSRSRLFRVIYFGFAAAMASLALLVASRPEELLPRALAIALAVMLLYLTARIALVAWRGPEPFEDSK